jgi:hypothetical protein
LQWPTVTAVIPFAAKDIKSFTGVNAVIIFIQPVYTLAGGPLHQVDRSNGLMADGILVP